MKVLLTGGSSFTGLWFARALAAEGHAVTATLLSPTDAYQGLRKQRAEALRDVAEVVHEVAFGSPAFLDLVQSSRFDLLCHHAAQVGDYRSPDFDVAGALQANTLRLRQVLEALRAGGAAGVVLTSSVFEADEGVGPEPREAFSPYGLSKTMTSAAFRFWCNRLSVPLGRFVIPNPFGPFEEPRFCDYLVRTWRAGEVPAVRTPLYVRDNIHVGALARAYAQFAGSMGTDPRPRKLAPSGYVESQGSFARRFAAEMSSRLDRELTVALGNQTEFDEPAIRINSDLIATICKDWAEAAAWDEVAEYYRRIYNI